MSRLANVRLNNGELVSLPEPNWCVFQHHDGLHAEDIFHEGPETAFTVDAPNGRFELLGASVTAYPFASTPAARVPHVTVDLGSGFGSFDPAGLRDLAAGLVVHAGRLRDLATVLERLRAEAGR
ncbi:hypothetical protein P3T35_003071 [Kitasatospora sp. GP30]|uniref:DUF6907 domain-containing protein n=1 Tax=Kitasatospora sp. GP30 TaxID=3035084 RepID=UPI000C70CE39|nr:hypothetical protein [Kitasatospora sp. GP30]MDH6141058.1 hypothetical protein [Kitasatospora sp. GP30]